MHPRELPTRFIFLASFFCLFFLSVGPRICFCPQEAGKINLLKSSVGWKVPERGKKKKKLRAEILNSANFTCISHAPGCALRAGREAPASAPSCTGTSSLQAGALGVGLVVSSSNLRCQEGSRDAAWQADLRLLCFGSTSLRLGLWGKTRTFLRGKTLLLQKLCFPPENC